MSGILVIVGPRSFADIAALDMMRTLVAEDIRTHRPDEIWSGGADGGDTVAELAAWDAQIPFRAILPQVYRKNGPGGFLDRDAYMAQHCDVLIGYACRWPSSFGAIHTANVAEKAGKTVERVVLPEVADHGRVEAWDKAGHLIQLLVRNAEVGRVAPASPGYAHELVGQPIDALLRRWRRDGWRVRWKSDSDQPMSQLIREV